MQKARRHPMGAPTACRRTVSGTLSLRFPRCFSPFPHGTSSLSVSREYLALADGAASFGQGSSGPALLRVRTGFGTVSRMGLSPAVARLPRRVPLQCLLPYRPPYNPARASTPAVWAGPLSLAATRGVTVVLLSSAYLDVSVRRVRLHHTVDAAVACGGFPHSDTRGSWAVRASPRPFAAFRVLLRLREPRHPPCALWYLSRTAPVRRLPATVVLPMCSSLSRCRTSALWRTSASLLSLLVSPSILSKNRGRTGLPLVESKGVEPLTPSLQSWCSSQLS